MQRLQPSIWVIVHGGDTLHERSLLVGPNRVLLAYYRHHRAARPLLFARVGG
jgi:hypothetical protein